MLVLPLQGQERWRRLGLDPGQAVGVVPVDMPGQPGQAVEGLLAPPAREGFRMLAHSVPFKIRQGWEGLVANLAGQVRVARFQLLCRTEKVSDGVAGGCRRRRR